MVFKKLIAKSNLNQKPLQNEYDKTAAIKITTEFKKFIVYAYFERWWLFVATRKALNTYSICGSPL